MENPSAYVVVRNGEEQYSIWRAGRRVPDGWTVVGEPAERAQCLDRIEELWTDMRPKSAR
ncbi:MbtH family NRPS accessory protein [Streptomyces sp. BE147]|uniref:MbtH family protein n=1 Tax=unclassified Streptomyces TaxID=2593676 RepID=UPI002E776051|nr:MbtH family NRPS accessory protein [Streptomyces sp. BE147]